LSEEKKKKKSAAWKKYEIDYKTGKIDLKNKKCSRCSKIMGHHQSPPRWSCGGCGYTEYIRKKPEAESKETSQQK